MLNINNIAANVPVDNNTYIGEDGLLHCSKCGGAREVIIHPHHKSGPEKVRCVCKCMSETKANEEKAEQIEKNRKHCFRGATKYQDATFADSEQTNELRMCRNYAEAFDKMRARGQGLLLWGPVETGKTHLAACIANEVVNQGYLAKLTSISSMVREMQSDFAHQDDYIYNLRRYDLLIIDDLGIERDTPYMLENLFSIIDSRLSSGLPMIITTNIDYKDLISPAEIENKRIYSRVTESCHPVEVKGVQRRLKKASSRYAEMEALLRGTV